MGTVSPLGYRTQNYMVVNGDAVDYEGGTVSAQAKTPFDNVIGDGLAKLLKNLGLYELLSMIYTMIYYRIVPIFGFIGN